MRDERKRHRDRARDSRDGVVRVEFVEGRGMTARDRFVLTRKYVLELDAIKAKLMFHGEEWHPESVYVKGQISDPTANQATYNVDILGDKLEKLRERETELESFIGETLEIIEHVRQGLGEEYANLLEQRYIDGLTWSQINVNKSTGKRKVSIAFDWIDSLGVKLNRGDYEL